MGKEYDFGVQEGLGFVSAKDVTCKLGVHHTDHQTIDETGKVHFLGLQNVDQGTEKIAVVDGHDG